MYDPAAGYVTGHGWIESPAGAYAAAPSQTGKAHFGFESRYAPGATTPSARTEFRFNVADFVFTSVDYDWLVVSGARAQYKGSGQVNGSNGYSFILTAIDGDAVGGGGTDRFRIKSGTRAAWSTTTRWAPPTTPIQRQRSPVARSCRNRSSGRTREACAARLPRLAWARRKPC